MLFNNNCTMSSKKNIWSHSQQSQLFVFHSQFGNRWAIIAARLGTKDQSSIKNKFYSTLRKGLRKINKYITDIKKKADPLRFKSFKTIQDIFISKLIAVVDRNYDEKYQVRTLAVERAAEIQKMLVDVARSDEEYLKPSKEDYNFQEGLLNAIMDFNKNCKKRKGKKKEFSEKGKCEENEEEIEEQSDQMEEKQSKKVIEKMEYHQIKTNRMLKQEKHEEFSVDFSPFLNGLEKKVSTSTIVKVTPESTCQFLKFCESHPESEDVPMIQSSNKITHSGFLKDKSWLYESTRSRLEMSKKLSYLTEATPFPYDADHPHSFGSLMKAKNITGSNMFEEKISCGQEFYSKESQGSFLNHVPVVKPKEGEFLIQSAEMKQQIEKQSLPFSSKHLEKGIPIGGSLFNSMQESLFAHYNNASFAGQYAFAVNQLSNTSPSLC